MGARKAVFATQILLIVSGINCFQIGAKRSQNLRLFAATETPQQSFAAPERPPQSFAAPQPPPPLRDGYEITATLDVAALPPDTRVPVALRAADAARFPTASKAKRACRRGEVMLNGRTARCGDAIRPGDRLELRARVNVTSYVQARFRSANAPFDLEVVYEDDYLAVVVKPAGVPTYSPGGDHGGRANLRSCLPFALEPPASCRAGDEVLRRPQPVHRLDKATSGLVLCAKTKLAAVGAARAFEKKTVKKRYSAVLLGEPAARRGVVTAPVPVNVKGLSVLKSARTVYAVEAVVDSLKASKLCLVKCAPRTGRTHQLRRHFAEALGRPIVGDVLYDGGGPEALNFRRSGLFLCARSLELDHPVTGARLKVRTGLPGKFSSLLEREARRAAALGDG